VWYLCTVGKVFWDVSIVQMIVSVLQGGEGRIGVVTVYGIRAVMYKYGMIVSVFTSVGLVCRFCVCRV
jgi:hypothetical protein